ncbi:hypothetical protein EW15_0477 [Prochlorococcus sp. MIT 0801]|nr:hypothetical protein EW15_0477 [Prochlorococcus sp. MIT 0801]
MSLLRSLVKVKNQANRGKLEVDWIKLDSQSSTFDLRKTR